MTMTFGLVSPATTFFGLTLTAMLGLALVTPTVALLDAGLVLLSPR